MGWFGWFDTETENKRDAYMKLYQEIEDTIAEHDKLVSEAESAYSSYKSGIPCMPEGAIPTSDYIPAQERLDQKLVDYLDSEIEHRGKLVRARNDAYERYIYYKNKAIAEAKEEK
jgi:hypothetical protein